MITPPPRVRRLVRPQRAWHPYITKVHRRELLEINTRLATLQRVAGNLMMRRNQIMQQYAPAKKKEAQPPPTVRETPSSQPSLF